MIQRGERRKALEPLSEFSEYPLLPMIAFHAFEQRGVCHEVLTLLGEAYTNYTTALKLQPYSYEARTRLQVLQEKRSQRQ